MVNLSRNNAEYKIFAPDINQMHVVNHTSGEEMNETRLTVVNKYYDVFDMRGYRIGANFTKEYFSH